MLGRRFSIVMAVLALVLAACGPKRTPTKAPTATSAPAATPTWAATTAPGDPAEGWKLFTSQTINGNPGCITCHSLKPGEVKVGPSLADIATDAAGDAEEWVVPRMRCQPGASPGWQRAPRSDPLSFKILPSFLFRRTLRLLDHESGAS